MKRVPNDGIRTVETRLAAVASNAEDHFAASPIATACIPAFRRTLLRWYDKNRRDLPWRKTRDPYAIWLSEIMLQQTRVAAVLNHYRVFLKWFPSIAALAAASEDAVLAAWSGLGYYRRARMLRECARQIVSDHRGRFPENAKVLQTLPGIGRYTAAAIGSIAFNEPVALVDGNVERVLERLSGRNLTPQQSWERAQALLSKLRPGDFNQAMMELGATVCLPREPRCLACSVRQWCAAQGEIPRTKALAPQKQKQIWCVLDRRDGHVRLVQRPKTASLMAGMWELPQWTDDPRALPPGKTSGFVSGRRFSDTENAPKSATPSGAGISTALGKPAAHAAPWRTFRHSITVTNYTVHVLRHSGRNGASCARGKRIAIDKIARLPITGLTRKILKADGII